MDPNFYSKNLLLLGKTYLKLHNRKLAAFWLTKAKDHPAHTEEDKQVQPPGTEARRGEGTREPLASVLVPVHSMKYCWLQMYAADVFGEGNGSPLQYSRLGNPVDRGAWRATVHGVAKSRT